MNSVSNAKDVMRRDHLSEANLLFAAQQDNNAKQKTFN